MSKTLFMLDEAGMAEIVNSGGLNGRATPVILLANGWTGDGPYSLTLQVQDVTSDTTTCHVIISPFPSSTKEYSSCMVAVEAQLDGSLLFSAETMPENNLLVNVLIITPNGYIEPIDRSEMNALLNLVYPVGCIYQSVDPTEPSVLFGGVWEPYSPGRVLIGAGAADSGTVYTAGNVGGNETETIGVKHFPANGVVSTNAGSSAGCARTTIATGTWCIANVANITGFKAGTNYGVPMNNMQPYNVVYRWLRIA